MSNRYGLQIRAATAADAPGLCDVMGACGLPVPAAERLGARLEALGRGGTALIAVEWGPPSGLVAVNWTRTLRTDAGVAHLDMLLVAPDSRRRGVGRLLLKAASQSARLAGCDELLVAAADTDLAAFLDATGFAKVGAAYARPLRRRS